ncbi:MAG: ATP-binding protein [Gemmatimonadota bacterium]
MSPPPPDVLHNPRRLEVLRRLSALDTPSDEGLDTLTELARELLGVPVALVTLVDADRQFFKSCLGLSEPWQAKRETPLSHSFCQHTIQQEDHLAIEDAREHPLVTHNLAIRDLGVVAYLGIPLITHDGQAIGSLCAIDHEPRKWTQEEVLLLRGLSGAVIQRLELTARMTELEETRDELARQETYYRSLIERGMGAVTVLDAEGRILYTSPNSKEVLGRTPEERAGRSAFDWVHPDDMAEVRETFGSVLARPNRTARAEFRYDHPEKGWIRIEGVGKNLLQEPVVAGLVFNFRDVTRERALEGELRERQKLETIGELTAGIAHDFNNLLTVVTANAELLRDGLRPGAQDAEEDLEDLQAAARGGAELIRSLMIFSRKNEPSLKATDLKPVVEQTCRMLRRILPSAIQVNWEAPSDLPPAHADPRAVEQILLNLATNARDAMPEGGSLSIRLSRDEAASHEEETIHWVRLEVTDTGCGMDAETLEQAFQPFFTTKDIGAGTGLGLAMIARLVEQHQGEIAVESVPERGTVITIRLREAAGAAQAPAQKSTFRSRAKRGELVLMVEDEEALRRTAQRVLERAGYQVVAAEDGLAGLEAFQARGEEISLVLSDQDMPRMKGTALLSEIRRSGSSVPFVLTTGYTFRDLQPEGDLPDNFSLLPKPWSLDEFVGLIRTTLDEAVPDHPSATGASVL